MIVWNLYPGESNPAHYGREAIIYMLNEYGDVLTVREMCSVLHIGRSTAYKLLRTKEIPSKKSFGGKYIIPKLGVERCINNILLGGHVNLKMK